MDKIKISQKEINDIYDIQVQEAFATDTLEPEIKEEVKEETKEESILTEEEEAQDKALEETLGWDTDFKEEEK